MSLPDTRTFQFPEVRIVEASAGSGKTYALAKRYVQLLLIRPDLGEGRSRNTLSPARAKGYLQENIMRSILAITFTNKAALEMKSRILDFLKNIALGTMPQEELREIVEPIYFSCHSEEPRQGGATKNLREMRSFADRASLGAQDDTYQEVRAKAYVLMEQLIRQYNFFQVQTIDSFIKTLLIGCCFKTGLTAGFRIRTNSPEYLEYALDELIDTARGQKKLRRMFEDFLHNYIYLENRSGWFPKKDMLDILRSLFAVYNNYGLEFKLGRVPRHYDGLAMAQDDGSASRQIIKLKKAILKDIKSLQKDLDEENFDKRFILSYEKFISEHDVGFDIDSIPAWFERKEPPVKKNGKAQDAVYKKWDKIHSALKEVCEAESHSLFNPYVEIFHETMSAFAKISTKEDVLFLEELNRQARELFKRGDISVGELYYRLATRFRHYLLDEFQDTSRLQWKNIEPLALEALSSGGSLFYVGDKKQAIYSFRGGEVELFDETRDSLKDYNVQVEPLAKNWRSQRAVVEFNNAVFSFDNLKGFVQRKQAFDLEKNKKLAVSFSEDDIQAIGKAFANSKQTYKPENTGGYVNIEHLNIDKKDERDEAVRARLILILNDLRQRFTLSDIAILTRNNKEVEQVTGWLLEKDIFVNSERTSNIRENPVIQEFICFLKFLNSPIDNLSFAQFITGEVFAKAVGDTWLSQGTAKCDAKSSASGVAFGDVHDFIFSVRDRVKNEKDFYIYMAFREKYPQQWKELFEEFFKNVGLYPMYEMVVTIYNRFGVLKNFTGYQGFLMRFLELIKREEEDHSGIESFLEYFENLEGEDLFVPLTDTDAVKVTTIHKSKGLEFPVVILPFLSMDVEVGEGAGELRSQSYVLQKGEVEIELLRLKSTYYSYSDELYEIYAREYKRAFLNELNTIYVALTRPMYELYGFISNKVGGSHNPMCLFVPEENYESGKPQISSPTRPPLADALPTRGRESSSKISPPLAGGARGGDSIFKLPPSEHHDWIGYLEDEFASFDQLKNRGQRLRGSVIHHMLSFIGNLSLCHPEGERSSTEGSPDSSPSSKAQNDVKKKALDLALNEAALNYPGLDNLKAHLEFVEKLIDNPALKPYMYVEGAEVATELEVVNSAGHTKRFDRLIIKEKAKEVWIMDFKSSSQDAEGKYKEQVKEYIAILKELHPKYKVKGFLVYMDKPQVEEVD